MLATGVIVQQGVDRMMATLHPLCLLSELPVLPRWGAALPLVTPATLTATCREGASGDAVWLEVRSLTHAVESPAALARAAEAAYAFLLGELRRRGLRPARLWNLVPDINRHADARGFGALEHYKHFNQGRRDAWLREDASLKSACAATAVGRMDGRFLLEVRCFATRWPLEHFENPRQVPFLRYSTVFGPPPAARRATLVRAPGAPAVLFVAGTASVVGERSVHVVPMNERVLPQTDETLENIVRILTQSQATTWRVRGVRVYLRHRAHLAEVRRRITARLRVGPEEVTLLPADICRRPLDVEIECVAVSP